MEQMGNKNLGFWGPTRGDCLTFLVPSLHFTLLQPFLPSSSTLISFPNPASLLPSHPPPPCAKSFYLPLVPIPNSEWAPTEVRSKEEGGFWNAGEGKVGAGEVVSAAVAREHGAPGTARRTGAGRARWRAFLARDGLRPA